VFLSLCCACLCGAGLVLSPADLEQGGSWLGFNLRLAVASCRLCVVLCVLSPCWGLCCGASPPPTVSVTLYAQFLHA
jgi:hypothetical protein